MFAYIFKTQQIYFYLIFSLSPPSLGRHQYWREREGRKPFRVGVLRPSHFSERVSPCPPHLTDGKSTHAPVRGRQQRVRTRRGAFTMRERETQSQFRRRKSIPKLFVPRSFLYSSPLNLAGARTREEEPLHPYQPPQSSFVFSLLAFQAYFMHPFIYPDCWIFFLLPLLTRIILAFSSSLHPRIVIRIVGGGGERREMARVSANAFSKARLLWRAFLPC